VGAEVTGWLLRRLLQALLVVVAMTLIVFVGLHAIGNPIDILIGEDMNQQERLAAIARLGLDQPLWRQYLAFVDGALHGSLGRSFGTRIDGAPAGRYEMIVLVTDQAAGKVAEIREPFSIE